MIAMTTEIPQLSRRKHWEKIYKKSVPGEFSWFQDVPHTSLHLISRLKRHPLDRLVDIGGGDSMLVDELLKRDYRDITILDISKEAIQRARKRLKDKDGSVRWLVKDILQFESHDKYDIWHDRACFHFMTDPMDRDRYIDIMRRSLRKGADLVLGTFADNGPEKCSGLDVVRYDEELLQGVLGDEFYLLSVFRESHTTPSGRDQNFIFTHFKYIP